MMRHSPRRLVPAARRGLTLIEMIIAMALTLAIFAAAVPFFRLQLRTVGENAARLDALQNGRFALSTLDRELRVAGSGVLVNQPLLVQADPYAVTFNANLVSRNDGDPTAVYINPDAEDGIVTSLSPTRRVTLPRSSFGYPAQAYTAPSGLASFAETISFWVSADSSTSRADDYVLFRRVNDADPVPVATAIVLAPQEPFFRYFVLDSAGRSDSVRAARLPAFHSVGAHGSVADTGASALLDSIRIVRTKVTTVFRSPDKKADIYRTAESNIRLLNAGMSHTVTCGYSPLPPGALTPLVRRNIVSTPGPGGVPQLDTLFSVRLSWTRSVDESGGEKDVERYLVFRRAGGAADWGEPVTSLAAGLSTYGYVDSQVDRGQQWQYGIASQDCSPANSSLLTTAVLTIGP